MSPVSFDRQAVTCYTQREVRLRGEAGVSSDIYSFYVIKFRFIVSEFKEDIKRS
jgi:hypothetical protein